MLEWHFRSAGGVQSTESVIIKCFVCSRDYRTYISETNCELLGGGSVFYSTLNAHSVTLINLELL